MISENRKKFKLDRNKIKKVSARYKRKRKTKVPVESVKDELTFLTNYEYNKYIANLTINGFTQYEAQYISDLYQKTNQKDLIEFITTNKLSFEKISFTSDNWQVIKRKPKIKEAIIIENNLENVKWYLKFDKNNHRFYNLIGKKVPVFYLENIFYSSEIGSSFNNIPLKERNIVMYRLGMKNKRMHKQKRKLDQIFNSNLEGDYLVNEIKSFCNPPIKTKEIELQKYCLKLEPLVIKYYEIRNSEVKQSKKEASIIKQMLVVLKEFAKKIELEIEIEAKINRLNKKPGTILTLEEVGQSYGVTRERIRQIENKGISRIKSENEIKKIGEYKLGLSNLVLKLHDDKINLEVEFNNPQVADNEYLLKKYHIYNDKYSYYKQLIEKKNKELFRVFMENLDDQQYPLDKIEKMYLTSLQNHGIYEEVMKTNKVDTRELEGRLTRMDNIIKSNSFKFRKWSGNYEKISKLIDHQIKVQKEIFSTKLLYDQLKDQLNKEDIIDYAELHYIMKKHKKMHPEIRFLRTPHVAKSNKDITTFVDEYIYEYDISKEDLALLIQKETGINYDTIIATYFTHYRKIKNEKVPINGKDI